MRAPIYPFIFLFIFVLYPPPFPDYPHQPPFSFWITSLKRLICKSNDLDYWVHKCLRAVVVTCPQADCQFVYLLSTNNKKVEGLGRIIRKIIEDREWKCRGGMEIDRRLGHTFMGTKHDWLKPNQEQVFCEKVVWFIYLLNKGMPTAHSLHILKYITIIWWVN